MTDDRTAKEIYEKIVAGTPTFESPINRSGIEMLAIDERDRLMSFFASKLVLKICRAGPEVFNYWVEHLSDHEAGLHDLYKMCKGEQKEIAKAGAAVWNYWQREEKETQITSDIDGKSLLDAGVSNFSGFHFLKAVSFSGAKPRGKIDFSGAVFSDRADFTEVKFSNEISFFQVKFSSSVHFERVVFFGEANFAKAIFCNATCFLMVTFSGLTSFDGAVFSRLVELEEVTFSGRTNFAGVVFSDRTYFTGVKFADRADFRNAEFQSLTGFQGCAFSKGPPIFHGANIHQGASFSEIKWPRARELRREKNKNELAEEWQRSYRTLKLAFAQHQSVREEQEFGRLEMEMETLRMQSLRKWSKASYLTAYSLLSDYGYSAKRPASWLLGLFVAGFGFSFLATNCSGNDAFILSLAYTLPPFVVSAEKLDTWYWFFWFAPQRLFSALLWFLILLAWRNQAKFK